MLLGKKKREKARVAFTFPQKGWISLASCAVAIALLVAATKVEAKAKEKSFEVFGGAGGGYEWFKLQSVGASVIARSLERADPSCIGNPTACIKPDELEGHGGLWRIYGGVRMALLGVSIDYRQSYIEGPIRWGQLMGDFWIFFPIPVVKPFIKIGAGWIHLKVKGVTLPGATEKVDGDLVKGFGIRGGVGLLIKPRRWLSAGATIEAAGTCFREDVETTWGYAIDLTAHVTVHL